MKSPYKVHFNKRSGWQFTVEIASKQRVFIGFVTEIQAGMAKRHVLQLISQDFTKLPSGRELRAMFPAEIGKDPRVKVSANEARELDAMTLHLRNW